MAAASYSNPRSSSPFRIRQPSQEKIPGFSPCPSPTPRSSTPRSNSPRLRFNSASSVDFCSPANDAMDFPAARESISVTVRIRPLSWREIQRGDQSAWYPDGDTLVRSEYNPSTAFAYDKVFGPETPTGSVYDVAASHVVRGAMEGIDGTVFTYGVTSSGKTHTMHGDQKSPGIIPLAIKHVFNIIQEAAGRKFLLRVSYLEIYNEVINDLLDPTRQNLRVREDAQGTYVEDITTEFVTCPADVLSLIAIGEEHRHVGSNNVNLLSSRSHTIFTLTVECGDSHGVVTSAQLSLIDLAGSESSKTDTTGIRRKEGSYINKSLLTLGTVISKLSDRKPSHIPYRDSKLTRLLQSSLSGHGRVSVICTITPASSNMEETHNTLKFAQRAKRVELHAAPNRIIDEKSLIKKYQKQITSLKQELEQFKRGNLVPTPQEDLLTLRQKEVKMQSRLEEQEQATAALMGRIQRLTKLILVSSKNSISANLPERPLHRRRHSFGEDELLYLPGKWRNSISDNGDDLGLTRQDTDFLINGKDVRNSGDEILKNERKNRNRGMFSWFKIRKLENESPHAFPVDDYFPSGPPASAPFSMHLDLACELKNTHQNSYNKRIDEFSPVFDSYLGSTQAGELFCLTACGHKLQPTGTNMAEQMDLLRELLKMLAGDIALSTSSVKRMSEQAANNPDDIQLQAQILQKEDEIEEKKQHMRTLEQRMIVFGETFANDTSLSDLQEVNTKLMSQLNERTFELEIKSADNRILQEQLQTKSDENDEAQEMVLLLNQQLASLEKILYEGKVDDGYKDESIGGKMCKDADKRTGLISRECSGGCAEEFQEKMLLLAVEIEKLKQEKVQLIEEKGGLEIQCQKLAEEASYAKELASAAAVELKSLAEDFTQLSFQNTELTKELETRQRMEFYRGSSKPAIGNGHFKYYENKIEQVKPIQKKRSIGGNEFLNDNINDIESWNLDSEDIKMELYIRKEREAALEAILAEKGQAEVEMQKTIDDLKKKEADLENDLAGMWVLVANLKMENEAHKNVKHGTQNINNDESFESEGDKMENKENEKDKETMKELATCLENEKRQGRLDKHIATLKEYIGKENEHDLQVIVNKEETSSHV
ncbi:kinesin-like protein KIN-7C, mitochondrial isoform X2 [Cryptomeria japonica]|uniref:kinesin-like protein KIN-7C, mitochondrial isoform X2 n=1 Tax=Cryptomeria japonica TaxID=3369 RepID=UPI0027DA0477|nr:kinesin-like protein KIN-7C, mitochondrial isoform X2 [Cryptomeria japonica]